MTRSPAEQAELAQLRKIAAVQPEIMIGDQTTPERRALFQAAGFTMINIDDRYRTPRIEVNPETGQREYHSAYQPQAAATGGPAGSPPKIEEFAGHRYLGNARPIDRFSLNPGADYYAEIPGTPPTMFGAGDLPVITGSGVPPETLRWVSWLLRHTAAFASTRADVALLIEASLEGSPDGWADMQSPTGRDAQASYFDKIATWVQTLPPEDGTGPLTEEEIARFYPDGDGG